MRGRGGGGEGGVGEVRGGGGGEEGGVVDLVCGGGLEEINAQNVKAELVIFY